jgi:hypothetical protein
MVSRVSFQEQWKKRRMRNGGLFWFQQAGFYVGAQTQYLSRLSLHDVKKPDVVRLFCGRCAQAVAFA